MSLKNPVTPPGIDPGTVRLVAQRLNHYGTPGPEYVLYPTKISTDTGFHPFRMDFLCDPPVTYCTHIFHNFTFLTWRLFCPINVSYFSTGLSPREKQITRILYSMTLCSIGQTTNLLRRSQCSLLRTTPFSTSIIYTNITWKESDIILYIPIK
jgi:hypothetical protein